ncbi:hypothetical protein [Spirosoma rhododendri]|uniref:Uncharacterized protein n=1 Tax=Spirosoma rhododendri TaxID=2728024 RepID=A0A7L5DPR1_9BACT|nr:hypothetical protein [Spirosoma rhododendri]QJD79572.1 hypothetical protein HH216_14975 [Spirosoma rhododendri]
MKKLTIAITDKAHDKLLELQLIRKKNKAERTSLADIAGDELSRILEATIDKK